VRPLASLNFILAGVWVVLGFLDADTTIGATGTSYRLAPEIKPPPQDGSEGPKISHPVVNEPEKRSYSNFRTYKIHPVFVFTNGPVTCIGPFLPPRF
jgi:hypothetical protein